MKKILIAVYDYYPEPSANSICLKKILDSMKSQNEIHIVCMKHVEKKCLDYEVVDNIYIHRITLLENTIAKKVIACKNKFLIAFPSKILSVWYNNFSIYGSSGYTRCYQTKGMQKVLEGIVNKYKIDTVLSLSYPFSTHVACSKLKEKYTHLKWIAYELDPFTFNFVLPAHQLRKREKLEMKVFKNVDKIISTLGIDEYNSSKNFRNEYRYKTVSVALPGLKVKDVKNITEKSILKSNQDKVNLVYSGSFYGNLRTPKPLFEILKDSEYLKDIVFHIIGGVIDRNQYPQANDFNIIEYERTSPGVCDASVVEADIAINFDNFIPNQMPSKILNYMALGKPIVNFYYKGCILGENCLKDYQPRLSICVDDVYDENIKKQFWDFVFKYKKSNGEDLFKSEISSELLNDYVTSSIIDILLE